MLFRSDHRPTGNYWSSIDERLTDGLATIQPELRKQTIQSSVSALPCFQQLSIGASALVEMGRESTVRIRIGTSRFLLQAQQDQMGRLLMRLVRNPRRRWLALQGSDPGPKSPAMSSRAARDASASSASENECARCLASFASSQRLIPFAEPASGQCSRLFGLGNSTLHMRQEREERLHKHR
jgi:hypothetical protein